MKIGIFGDSPWIGKQNASLQMIQPYFEMKKVYMVESFFHGFVYRCASFIRCVI